MDDQRSTLGDIMDNGLWRSRAAYVCQSNNFAKILSRYVVRWVSVDVDPDRSSGDRSSACSASSSPSSSLSLLGMHGEKSENIDDLMLKDCDGNEHFLN